VRPFLVPAFAMLFWKDDRPVEDEEDGVLRQLAPYRKAS
jgi:hypothetical protein